MGLISIQSITDTTDSNNVTSGVTYTITVTFNEPLYIDNISLILSSGDTANYLSGDGTDTYDFTFTAAATATGVTLTGATIFGEFYSYSDFGLSSAPPICFLAGTHIDTPTGERRVEDLRPGDRVLTADGLSAPARWIGRQTVSTRFADPLRTAPIRIRAGALAEGHPRRDLLVSPDHALLVDELLVQAGALVNGVSILRETDVPEAVVYYHVELDDHALIMAEGAPAETFIDNVQRLAFDNWAEHEALYPHGKPMAEMALPRALAHRQVPRATRERLAARAAALFGWRTAAA